MVAWRIDLSAGKRRSTSRLSPINRINCHTACGGTPQSGWHIRHSNLSKCSRRTSHKSPPRQWHWQSAHPSITPRALYVLSTVLPTVDTKFALSQLSLQSQLAQLKFPSCQRTCQKLRPSCAAPVSLPCQSGEWLLLLLAVMCTDATEDALPKEGKKYAKRRAHTPRPTILRHHSPQHKVKHYLHVQTKFCRAKQKKERQWRRHCMETSIKDRKKWAEKSCVCVCDHRRKWRKERLMNWQFA